MSKEKTRRERLVEFSGKTLGDIVFLSGVEAFLAPLQKKILRKDMEREGRMNFSGVDLKSEKDRVYRRLKHENYKKVFGGYPEEERKKARYFNRSTYGRGYGRTGYNNTENEMSKEELEQYRIDSYGRRIHLKRPGRKMSKEMEELLELKRSREIRREREEERNELRRKIRRYDRY